MNSSDFTYLLNHPESVGSDQLKELDEIVQEFPYFQSARALQLKGLKASNSFKYNQALKKTASYTMDRAILFDFITASFFNVEIAADQEPLLSLEENEKETIEILHKKITDSIAFDLEKSRPEAIDPQTEEAEITLEIGHPISFIHSNMAILRPFNRILSN